MKRVLICISDFRQGGIPRCLQTLLMNIDTKKYQIDLLCLSKEGPYNGQMPNCRILQNDYVVSQLMVQSKKICAKNVVKYIPSIMMKVIRTIYLKVLNKDLLKLRLKVLARKQCKYDCAIAYAEGFPALVVESVNSLGKLIWIHNDYRYDVAREGAQITNFDNFDRICCVSKTTQQSFVKRYPQYKNKTLTIYNLINIDYIVHQSEKEIHDECFDTSSFTIISIGRICAQKRFYCIPEIAKEVKRYGVHFRWYIVGGGQDAEVKHLMDNIITNDVVNDVILLGEKSNPYNYLKKSDIFVLTSLYESYPTVINEARVLNVPIVSVDIEPVKEMLDKNEAKIIPLNMMAEAIVDLYYDRKSLDVMKTIPFRSHNIEVLQSFYELVETSYGKIK